VLAEAILFTEEMAMHQEMISNKVQSETAGWLLDLRVLLSSQAILREFLGIKEKSLSQKNLDFTI
jgi:hypothetical protein